MKQEITKEQWEEIAEKEQRLFEKSMSNGGGKYLGYDDLHGSVNIGIMIEFLEYSFNELSIGYNDSGCFWTVMVGNRGTGSMIEGCDVFKSSCEIEELADALWEAVKYSLKESIAL